MKLFFKLNGRKYLITEVFTDIDKCNEYLTTHPREGVGKVCDDGLIYVISNHDMGQEI